MNNSTSVLIQPCRRACVHVQYACNSWVKKTVVAGQLIMCFGQLCLTICMYVPWRQLAHLFLRQWGLVGEIRHKRHKIQHILTPSLRIWSATALSDSAQLLCFVSSEHRLQINILADAKIYSKTIVCKNLIMLLVLVPLWSMRIKVLVVIAALICDQ